MHLNDKTSDLEKALILYNQGNLKEAELLYRNILKLDPNHAEANNMLGIIAHATGNLDAAIKLFSKAILNDSKQIGYFSNLGNTLAQLERFDEALKAYSSALRLSSNCAEIYYNMGYAMECKGDKEKALLYYKKSAKKNKSYLDPHFNIADLKRKEGYITDAMSYLEKSINMSSNNIQAHKNIGIRMKYMGKPHEANEVYKKILELNPHDADTLREIGRTKRYNKEDPDIKKLLSIYNNLSIDYTTKLHACFALGKAYEDLQEYQKSFTYYQEGNQLRRSTFNYDLNKDINYIEIIKKFFTKQVIERLSKHGCSDASPIFIVGMPRSGTSLTEQIVSSHPNVYGAGELGTLSQLFNSIQQNSNHEAIKKITELKSEQVKQIGLEYIHQIRNFNDSKKFLTDKMPSNYALIGFIKSILPKAKIIHCMREPMDICFSIYKNLFSQTRYYFDMHEIGTVYRLYQEIMAHWKAVLPNNSYYEIQYETLIDNQRLETKKLLEYCELEWDEQCLSFEHNQRSVETASAFQVRQPIYKDSVKKWKHYEQWLQPIINELK